MASKRNKSLISLPFTKILSSMPNSSHFMHYPDSLKKLQLYCVFSIAAISCYGQAKEVELRISYLSHLPKLVSTVNYVRVNISQPENNSLTSYKSSELYKFDAKKYWERTPTSRLSRLYALGNIELDTSAILNYSYECYRLIDSLKKSWTYPIIKKDILPKNPNKIWKKLVRSGFLNTLKEEMRYPSYYSWLDSLVVMTLFERRYPQYFEEKIVKVTTEEDDMEKTFDYEVELLNDLGKGCRIFIDRYATNPFFFKIEGSKKRKKSESDQDGISMVTECQYEEDVIIKIPVESDNDILFFWVEYSDGRVSPFQIWSGDSDVFYWQIHDNFAKLRLDPLPMFIQN